MGPHFSREFGGGGRQDRQFPSLTSEHCKQWSYLSITDTKAANEKGIGAFSAENTSVPRGYMRGRPPLSTEGPATQTCAKGCLSASRMPGTYKVAAVSLPEPKINSLCLDPPDSD